MYVDFGQDGHVTVTHTPTIHLDLRRTNIYQYQNQYGKKLQLKLTMGFLIMEGEFSCGTFTK